jgi:hypothetical protein
MTTRSVFKIFGSLGPGGSIVSLMEKYCKWQFREAYDLGNPNQFSSMEDDKLKEARKEMIEALFKFRSTFERESVSVNPTIKDQAYKTLKDIVSTHKNKIMTVERQRLTKERVFYLRENDYVKYEQAVRELAHLKVDVDDNCDKMVKSLFENMEWARFSDAPEINKDADAATIGERIDRYDAEKYHAFWKQLKAQASLDAHREGGEGDPENAE